MNTENINAVKWFHSHKCNSKNKELSFRYFYTSIGTGTEAICSCGKSIDVTNYDLW